MMKIAASSESWASAGAFLAAEATGAIEQAWRKPLEAHWYLPQFAIQASDDAVYETAADQGFADDGAS